jgi:hypothetical protein
MKNPSTYFLHLTCLLLASCSLLQETTLPPPQPTRFRVVNMNPGYEEVSIGINGSIQSTLQIGQSTTFYPVNGGDLREIRIKNKEGDDFIFNNREDLDVLADSIFYEFAPYISKGFYFFKSKLSGIEGLTNVVVPVEEETRTALPGKAKVRFMNLTDIPNFDKDDINLSPRSIPVGWYGNPIIFRNEAPLAPESIFKPATYITSVSFGDEVFSDVPAFRDYSDYELLPAGSTSIFVAVSREDIINKIPTYTYNIALQDGHNYSLLLTGSASSTIPQTPIRFFIIDESSGEQPQEIQPVPNTAAKFRYINTGNFRLKGGAIVSLLIDYVPSKASVNTYVTIPSEKEYLINLTKGASIVPNFYQDSVRFEPGETYTLITSPTPFNSSLNLLYIKEEPRAPAGKALLRLTNTYLDSGPLRFTVTGNGLAQTVENIAFNESSDYLEVNLTDSNNIPITYTVSVAQSDGTLLYEAKNVSVADNRPLVGTGIFHYIITGTADLEDGYVPVIGIY